MTWQLVFTKQAQKDARKLAAAGLRGKAEQLLEILAIKSLPASPAF
jgi:mRNA-degrading endonuclease RelE of RelBE toxin-antitoxin system